MNGDIPEQSRYPIIMLTNERIVLVVVGSITCVHYYGRRCTINMTLMMTTAKFPHSAILHDACRLLLTENNGKNNAIAMEVCAVFSCFLVAKQRTTYIEPHA